MALKILIVIAILGLFCCMIYSSISDDEINKEIELSIINKYHGPVPLGYNQTHFWKTGEMILEDNK